MYKYATHGGIRSLAACAATSALLAASACSAADSTPTSASATATSMGQVKVVYLQPNTCASGITSALGERGFSVTTAPAKVDAILSVKVNNNGRNLDEIPHFGGVGKKASYSATLKGADGKLLFSTSGSEGSIDESELCGDIGDEIGDRMQKQ